MPVTSPKICIGNGNKNGVSIIKTDAIIVPDNMLPYKRTANENVDEKSLKIFSGVRMGVGSTYFFKYRLIPAFLMP